MSKIVFSVSGYEWGSPKVKGSVDGIVISRRFYEGFFGLPLMYAVWRIKRDFKTLGYDK